jgi:hypothetical protein
MGPGPLSRRPSDPVFCSGWRGRIMTGRQATIWVYGSGRVAIRFSGNALVRVLVDGRESDPVTLDGQTWHSLLLMAPRAGLRLESISLSP